MTSSLVSDKNVSVRSITSSIKAMASWYFCILIGREILLSLISLALSVIFLRAFLLVSLKVVHRASDLDAGVIIVIDLSEGDRVYELGLDLVR